MLLPPPKPQTVDVIRAGRKLENPTQIGGDKAMEVKSRDCCMAKQMRRVIEMQIINDLRWIREIDGTLTR